MTFTSSFARILVAVAMAACGPPGLNSGDAGTDGPDADLGPMPDDEDSDGISDQAEGKSGRTDSDFDGTPDYLDDDSDGDGIPDSVEAGTAGDPRRAPADSDSDGTPDFRDIDSDGNGIFDATEGWADTDSDGEIDSADWDNDGDTVPDADEIGDNPSRPTDTDEDGTADYMDDDSDADTIADVHEMALDTDRDGTADFRDQDSDQDGISDAVEAGDADVATPPADSDRDGIADFRDPDSDNDGLADSLEATNGTDPRRGDTDSDGVSDLIEVAAGTSPTDPADSPRTRGDFVFTVPYQAPPDPLHDTLSFSTNIQYADVYFLVDCTFSMNGEIANLQAGLTGTIIPGVAATIPDVQFGVGRFEDYPADDYGSGEDRAFEHLLWMTASAADAQAAVNSMYSRNGADIPESDLPALHAVATGCGDGSIPNDPGGACGNPALIGYPHFRAGAVPVIVLITDAPFHNGPSGYGYSGNPAGATPPTYDQTVAALNAIHARVIGVNSGEATGDLATIATATGTVGAAGPLVYQISADGTGLGGEIITGIAAMASQIRMNISARAADDPADAVDALVFIDQIIPTPDPAAPCTAGLTVSGNTYTGVLPGTTVCFDIVPRQNDTVMPTAEPQVYLAKVQVWGDEVTLLDERDVYFLVPPVIRDPGAPG
jgi:hypothetical protein